MRKLKDREYAILFAIAAFVIWSVLIPAGVEPTTAFYSSIIGGLIFIGIWGYPIKKLKALKNILKP